MKRSRYYRILTSTQTDRVIEHPRPDVVVVVVVVVVDVVDKEAGICQFIDAAIPSDHNFERREYEKLLYCAVDLHPSLDEKNMCMYLPSPQTIPNKIQHSNQFPQRFCRELWNDFTHVTISHIGLLQQKKVFA